MRCEKCGALLGNKIIKINGTVLCENCAREFGIEDPLRGAGSLMGAAFPLLDELTAGIMGAGSDLEFANTKLKCQRCGSTLRDVESTGILGCIECYNTFSDILAKKLLRKQGSTEYVGRVPGVPAEGIDDEVKEPSKEEPAPAKPAVSEAKEEKPSPDIKKKEDILERIKNADLGMVTDDDLQEAMNMAVDAEDYLLAARLRDELRSRRGGN
ncbi:MAG: UvrB/UvrC motif-containing protein [Clostridiales bacterium]|nr:UvrB/UvrC motif-containing protein [Clostridiales bacterium]